MQSENVDLISAALVKAQGVMKAATYNKVNPHFKNKYADLAAVIDAVRKPMAENGLGFTQTMYATDTALFLTTTLRHTSGQWISSEYPLPMGAIPQQLGSALTYARRYSCPRLLASPPMRMTTRRKRTRSGHFTALPKNSMSCAKLSGPIARSS